MSSSRAVAPSVLVPSFLLLVVVVCFLCSSQFTAVENRRRVLLSTSKNDCVPGNNNKDKVVVLPKNDTIDCEYFVIHHKRVETRRITTFWMTQTIDPPFFVPVDQGTQRGIKVEASQVGADIDRMPHLALILRLLKQQQQQQQQNDVVLIDLQPLEFLSYQGLWMLAAAAADVPSFGLGSVSNENTLDPLLLDQATGITCQSMYTNPGFFRYMTLLRQESGLLQHLPNPILKRRDGGWVLHGGTCSPTQFERIPPTSSRLLALVCRKVDEDPNKKMSSFLQEKYNLVPYVYSQSQWKPGVDPASVKDVTHLVWMRSDVADSLQL